MQPNKNTNKEKNVIKCINNIKRKFKTHSGNYYMEIEKSTKPKEKCHQIHKCASCEISRKTKRITKTAEDGLRTLCVKR